MDERTLAIFDAFQAGRLSRRQFVRRLAGLGFAGGTIALFLAACGGAAATPTTAPTARPPAAAPTTAPIPTPAPIATQPAPTPAGR